MDNFTALGKRIFDEQVIEKRKQHRAIGPAYYCAFFGFQNDKELEDQIYNDIDKIIEERFKGFFTETDSVPIVLDYLKEKNINNVIFTSNGYLGFYKMGFCENSTFARFEDRSPGMTDVDDYPQDGGTI